MTYPPPIGEYPSPPGGGYPPPPLQTEFAGPPGSGYGVASPETYTPWLTRVLAWLIDWLPIAILSGIGAIFLVALQKVETVCVTDSSEYQLGDFCATGSSGPSGLGWALFAAAHVIALGVVVWNLGYRQGATGSSIGKGILRFAIVGEETGRPIGVGKSTLRELLYLVAYFAIGILWLVAVLFPLWDSKRQTLVDKLVNTVALPL